MYFIHPQGTPSHTLALEARLDSVTSFPYIPSGLTIEWRQDGSPIPGKSGSTNDLALHRINTGDAGDYNFDATDSGTVIDFVIDGTAFSSPVVLSNQQPSLSGATVVEDSFDRALGRPAFSWTYTDADGDEQFLYVVKIGTAPSLGDIYDTGQVSGAASSFALPDTEPEMADGTVFYWTIQVSDGEKTTPTDADSTTDRVLVSASGSSTINTPPSVSDVKVDGLSASPQIESYAPTFSWTYADADGQPQGSYRVRVSESSDMSDPVWDSGDISGTAASVVYNYDATGVSLIGHTTYYVGITLSDGLEDSTEYIESFSISNAPVITEAFVDDKFNPTNLSTSRPTFTWTVLDDDADPMIGYELRVSDDLTDLGTDSFVGNIWSTGFVNTPEAFEAILDEDGAAFPGCEFPKNLEQGVKYYFQVRVEDQYESSTWFTGCFKLNDPPTATSLSIVPDEPFTSDDLEAVWTFVDDDGEGESSQTEIRWYKNGTEVTAARNLRVLPASLTAPFEEWYVTVRPHDGVEFGSLVQSDTVLIANRAPTATSLAIAPTNPLTGDALEALFAISDPDGDTVTVSINWYKNGIEQVGLRNMRSVAPLFTSVGDEWYFEAIPTDGYTPGVPATSPTVEIGNTRPEILSLSIDGQILPLQLFDPNPVISWSYLDADGHAQNSYQVVIGTKAFRTSGGNASAPNAFFCVRRDDGIVSIAENGTIVSGNDIFDSGVVESSSPSLQYATDDFVPQVSVGASDTIGFDGYIIDSDLTTIRLGAGKASGEVFFGFPGQSGAYEGTIEISGDGRRSNYTLVVDGVAIDSFSSGNDVGEIIHTFRVASIDSDSRVSIRGSALDPGARGGFLSLTFAPVTEFSVNASSFDSLNGYVSDGSGGIKLAGLAGTATLDFPYPTGNYDVEIEYVTETSGVPTVSIAVNSSTVDTFSYQTGVKTRIRTIQDVAFVTGDSFKISGSRGGSASARVKSVTFKPTQTIQTGVKLQDGIQYFASVRVNDGIDWSDWHTTSFTMGGSAWVSSVENSVGWTIEAKFRLGDIFVSEDDDASTQTDEVAAPETAESTNVLDTIISALQESRANDPDQQVAAAAPSVSCETDSFQGIRFYDGTAFGWLRLKPDKVELLIDSPVEYALDGTVPHLYRITVVGRDIKLYVDNELVINGTSRFIQPTSRKILEFGDIAGRTQRYGSEWESFRYSVTGAFAPNALVDYALDEIQRFPDASIGRMQTYGDNLYVSVNPNDPSKSSSVYRYSEGYEPESRSVLALTRSMTTAIVVDPNRRGNLFDTSGKFVGTHRGLQYLLGSRPSPFDSRTAMTVLPDDNGWELESTCDGVCNALNSGIMVIDTRGETSARHFRYVQREPSDAWVQSANNAQGWTVEARVKIGEDGAGSAVINESAAFASSSFESCDPAQGISVGGLGNAIPDDDGLNAPGILVNDGVYQEVVQFFETGIRLKYAGLFASQTMNDQFYTVRIIGKGRAIAVYVKGDNDRFFRRVIFAPDGLFVESQPVGDQEIPNIAIDDLGSTHAVFQDSRNGKWDIFYSKTLPGTVVARGAGMYSSSFADFEKFVKARPGFSLPADDISNTLFTERSLFSGGASFSSWGVKPGDSIFIFSNRSNVSPRKFIVSNVDHETVIKVNTEEDLSDLYDGAEYVIMRGEERWLPPIQVSQQMMDSNNPKIILNSRVSAYVAYDNSENGSSEVYVRRGIFDPFYMNWQETVRVTNATFDSRKPDIAELGEGIVVVWQDSRNDPEKSEIFASRIDSATFGVLDAYENKNITEGSNSAQNACIAVSGSKVYVAYQDDPDSDGSYDVFVVELDASFSVVRTVQVSSGLGNAVNPSISGSDTSVSVAFEDDQYGVKEIFSVRISSANTSDSSFGPTVRVTDSRGRSERPDIFVDERDNVFVAFQDNRTREEFSDLYVSRYDAALGEWLSSAQDGLDVKVESYTTSSCNPSVAVDRFGNIALAWESAREGGLKRIARTSFDGLVSMDKSVIAYFPLDENGQNTEVVNKYRLPRGSSTPPLQVVFVVNKSSEMDSGDRLADAKSLTGSLVNSLGASDEFNIIFFNSSTQAFQGDLVVASDENKTSATTFVSSVTSSGTRGLNNAIQTAFASSFATDGSRTPMVVIIDTGSSDDLSKSTFDAENENVGAIPMALGVDGASKAVLLGIVGNDDALASFKDDFDGLSETFADFFEKFDAVRAGGTTYDLSLAAAANGTAFNSTDLYHIDAFDPGVSLRNPQTQGAFDLNENGKGFRIPSSLLNATGAIDIWFKPSWPSVDITERVIFGNAAPSTTTPNTMVFGARPAIDGNDIFFRVVDSRGNVHETYVNNPVSTGAVLVWDVDEIVHLRTVWDQNAIGVSTIRSMSFPTTSIGYAVSEAGGIWKTTDGGTTWEERASGVTYELYSIDFIDASTGWACGEFGTVLRTSDGGGEWESIDTGIESDLHGIFFKDASTGYAVGDGGAVIYSTDGGNTWTAGESGTTTDLRDVALASDGVSPVVVAVGLGPKVIRSLDDGATYSSVSVGVSRHLRGVSRTHQAGSYATYAVGDAGTIIKTTNLGASWSNVSHSWDIGFQPHLYGVSHGPDSDNVFVAGQDGRLAASANGGSTFTEHVTAVEDGSFRAIEANFGGSGDNSTLVAAGVGGTVMLSSDAGATQVYAMTRSGNLCIYVNGAKPPQIKINDGPFEWDPSSNADGLVFGDFEENGSRTAGGAFDEIIVYRAPPPHGAILRRKEMWTYQATEATLLVSDESEKRIEWGDISSDVRTLSFWTRVDMSFCGAKEPLQVFGWDSQLGLVDDVVRDLALDKSGRLWIATEHGITSFDVNSANEDIERWTTGRALKSGPRNRFINYTNIVDGLVADDVSCIAVDDADNIWAGTSRGLMLLELNEESFVEGGQDPIDLEAAIDDDPSREAGDPGLGTFAEDGEVVNAKAIKFRTFTVDDGLPSNNILTVESIQGAIFVGTDKGLVVISIKDEVVASSSSETGSTTVLTTVDSEGNEATTTTETSESTSSQTTQISIGDMSIFTVADGLPSNRIQAISEERRTGDIWIGTDRGLARFFPEGSISYDTSSGLINTDIFSITVDSDDRKFVGTGFGITKIDGTNFQSFQPSDGTGFGAILDGDEDGVGVKWFATANGILEMNESCPDGVRFTSYGVSEGLIGQPGIADYQRYYLLGDSLPVGGCNKAMVGVAVNGVQLSEGFDINECVPWIIFDTPLGASDRVQACVHRGWRKSHDFGFDPRNPESLAFVQTATSRYLLYRRRFRAGTVILGANFAQGTRNKSTKMYTVFSVPIAGSGSSIDSVTAPAGAVLSDEATQGVTSIYSDLTEPLTLIAADLVGAQHIALPSVDQGLIDDEYLEFTLSSDAYVYVAFDSRATSLPGWLRDFSPVGAVYRVTDMDTFVDATGIEKLFMSVSGSAGCVFDLLQDPDVCDISDQIALDEEPPTGCATIVRLNSADEAVLSLTAEDAVTGVASMQISAFENFTTDGTTAAPIVPFQTTYNLPLPPEATDPIVAIEDSAPPDSNPLDGTTYPNIEYTIAFEHNGQILLGTRNPGRVFAFNRSTQAVSFLFDTGEDDVVSMASFGSDLIVGTTNDGKAFRWNGTTLSEILLPSGDAVTALAVFNSKVYFGTSPDGQIYTLDQFGAIQLFHDTNETSVDGFAIFAGNLFWVTSNDQVDEGDILSLTTRRGHRHTITVPAGTDRVSEVSGTTSSVDGHTHTVTAGTVSTEQGHTHILNGDRSGKVFRLNPATGLSTIVHSDRDSFMTSIVSTTIAQEGLMFAGTFPNGKILRYVPSEGIFIKSFDTVKDHISRLKVIDSVVYAVADDDIFYFDGRRWQFFGSGAENALDIIGIGDDILVVRSDSLGTVSQVQSDGTTVPSEICAYVRFVDAAGNTTEIRDADGNIIECFRPCITPDDNGQPSGDGGGIIGDDLNGDGITDNPLLAGIHRIVEIDEDARSVFTLNGPEPFLSGNRIEEEVGVYFSEVFNGTTSLVQWESIAWTAVVPSGATLTLAVRSANTSAEISSAEFGAEFSDASGNDLTNLTGQFLQFRATLIVSEVGVASPQLDFVDIRLRTSQAVHYYTTNFVLPDELRRGLLTYNGCLNPPATDIVFGISGKDSVDFSDYFVITPDKVFEVPSDHRTENLRVGIKLISSPDQVPVVDEFALLFSLANDAKIRLNLAGDTGTTSGGPIIDGDTRTVTTEQVQGHSHTITFDATITDEAGINGQTSINAGHSHLIINGIVQQSAGHSHEFSIE